MKTCRTSLLLAALIAAPLFLSGCGGNFLLGKWTLDKDRTLEAMSPPADNSGEASPGGGLLKDIVGGLQKGLSRVLLTQFEGTEIEFTTTEMRKVKNGVGEAQPYEIIEKPEPGTCLVKTGDGNITTWSRADGGIRMKLSGETDAWVYFRKAP